MAGGLRGPCYIDEANGRELLLRCMDPYGGHRSVPTQRPWPSPTRVRDDLVTESDVAAAVRRATAEDNATAETPPARQR